jgi:Fe-S cluster assembly protein SufD
MTNTTMEPAVTLPGTFDEKAFETFLAGRDEPSWVTDARRKAFAVFQEKSALPLDPEEWKRVDLRTFRPEKFQVAQPELTSATTFKTLMQHRGEFVGHVTHVNGRCTQADLAEDLKSKGVLFGNLAEMVHEHRDIIEPHLLSRAVAVDTDRFSAWHAAFWTGGTVLYVPRNVQIIEPLYSLIALSQAGQTDLSHTLVILEDGAKATLLEETASADENSPGLHLGAVELLLGREARLRYVQLQNWNEKTYHIAHQAGRVEANGFLQWTVGGLGARLAHIHQDVNLDGRGAEAEVNGVTFATGRQVLSYYTKQSHNAPNTRSDLLYKEVLRDRARVVWRGMIRVEPEAQQTDGYQRSAALMLSPDARCDSVPGLEIEADDVRCTHAATAGRVDEEEIFYCMCRGMTEYEAMHIIVEGFFREVLDRIPIELPHPNKLAEEDEAYDESPTGIVRATLSHAVETKLGIGD